MASDSATMDVSRGPVGGIATISLGSENPADMFNQRQHEKQACGETPDAVQRFPQAPGGSATIHLGGGTPDEVVATKGPVGGADSVVFGACQSIAEVPASRGPVGGMATVVLGGDSATQDFNQRHNERNATIETPDAVPRFQQAPGGTSSIVLGSDGSAAQCGTSRGPVGGQTTVVLGCDNSKEIYAQRKEQREMDLQTPDPISRFQQAPGGTTSICLGNASVEAVPCRGPVGGGTTIVFGDEDPAKAFAQHDRNSDLGEAPDAAPRFQQAPGGDASICLGGNGLVESVSQRGPVGGTSTIVIGDGCSAQGFIDQKHGAVETPDAAPRFQQAPGGAASICLGDEQTAGERTLPAMRGAVGGETTILLGSENRAASFTEHSKRADQETPDAAPRFQQVPGGFSSISLGGENSEVLAALASSQNQAQARKAVPGPQTTVVLGAEQSDVVFSQYQQERHAVVQTPDAAPRFQQAPGGSASICLGAGGAAVETPSMRGPVGGQSSIVLGGDDSGEAFRNDRLCASDVMTPNAAPRFQQAPGGSATVQLGNEKGSSDLGFAEPTRGPVGGVASIVLGGENHATTFAEYNQHHASSILTPHAPPRFQQAPGGSATIQLGTSGGSEAVILATPTKGPVGGLATIVLGGDDPSAAFIQNQTSVETPDALQRFTQAPGGTATLVLGGAVVHQTSNQLRQSPGGSSTLVLGGNSSDPFDTHCVTSANKFANGANQNCGNTITDRSTTRLHSAPGGASTICLGYDDVSSTPVKKSMDQFARSPDPTAVRVAASPTPCRLRQSPGGDTTISFGGNADDPFNTHQTSSNQFASGANQNSGNTITDRSTTRLHHAPGGASSLCLGSDDPAVVAGTSSNKFASGANQNSGNTITDRSTTRLHHAPGGASSLCLGSDDPAVVASTSSNKFASGANQNSGNTITDRSTTRLHHAPGGASSLCLGSDVESAVILPERSVAASPGAASGPAAVVGTSSNKFASGVNQNSGNTITDRSSTRVHQAPGGASTVCLGAD